MQFSTHSNAFITTPLIKPTPKRARVTLKPTDPSIPPSKQPTCYHQPNTPRPPTCTPNLTKPSTPNKSNISKPSSKSSRFRTILLAVLAAAATALPIHRIRSHKAVAIPTTTTTIARATPSDTRLHHHRKSPNKSHKPLTVHVHKKKLHTDSHGLGNTPFLVAGSAALLASALAVAITHPIDTLKTMKQARQSGLISSDQPITLPALYRGLFSNMLKEAPNAAIYLAAYELFKSVLLSTPFFAAFPLLAMCIAGMLGDGVGSVVRVPAEIINKRLQLGLNNSWGSAIRDSFLSANGVESTLAAWEAVLWRDVPYGGLQIAAYEFFRISLAGAGYTGFLYSIFAGAGAGLLAAVMTTPADVLVTRMSTQSPQCYLETKHYMSPTATLRRIVRDEGFKALWTGALHRGLFYMPMIGLFFAAYESFKYVIINPSVLFNVAVGLMRILMGVWKFIVGTFWSCLFTGVFKIPLGVLMFSVLFCLLSERRHEKEWTQH